MSYDDGNRLVADFMRLTKVEKWNGKNEYHTSWDLLMPVVEKIFLLREVEDILIGMGEVKIFVKGYGVIKSPCLPENTFIQELWLAVVQFIQWRNKTSL